MKRAIIISDSHGYLDNVHEVFKIFSGITTVFHLGDVIGDVKKLEKKYPKMNFYTINGNNDYDNTCLERIVPFGGMTVYMTHGHKHGVNSGLMRLSLGAKEKEAQITLFGHTHRPFVDSYLDLILINPGSISQPRNTDGPTFGILEVGEDGTVIIQVYELNNQGVPIKILAKKY